jgi:hypothetical protein
MVALDRDDIAAKVVKQAASCSELPRIGLKNFEQEALRYLFLIFSW